MKFALYVISLISIYIYIFTLLKREVHMFQQNSYMYGRYIRWYIRDNKKEELRKGIFGLLSVIPALFGLFETAFILFSIYYLSLSVYMLRTKRIEKKKLVYTNRVKRLYASMILLLMFNALYSIASFYGALLPTAAYMALNIVFASIPQIIVIIGNALVLPAEKMIVAWYVRDAKKIIDSHKNLKVVGITGSYGKTSTKHMLYEILRLKFDTLMTPESYNTTMGVVRTIREKLTPVHEVFIVEMGAKKSYDIREICDIVKPLYGVITSIGKQHLETFKSLENIVKTKFELFDSLPSYGTGFVNKDDANIIDNLRSEQLKFMFYSIRTKNSDYFLHDIAHDAQGTSFVITTVFGESHSFRTKLLGEHNLYNILSAVCAAHTLGMTLDEISQRVMDIKPVAHRLELKKTNDNELVIDDAYNSNPQGAKEALKVLGSFSDHTRILVTPGMVELGDAQDEENMRFGEFAARNCDHAVLVGLKQTEPVKKGLEKGGFLMEKCHVVKNLGEALKVLDEIKKERNVVLFENDLPDIYEDQEG